MEERYRFTGFEQQDGLVVAVCNCGWRSAPHPSAGSAGDAADRHRAERSDHANP